MNAKMFNKADIVLIIFFSLTALAFNFVLYAYSSKSNVNPKIVIKVDGELKAEVLLSQNTVHEIKSIYGVNVIEINDGVAKMISADCRDQVCVWQKQIHYSNEVIVCLPHRLIVEIEDQHEENDLDMISY